MENQKSYKSVITLLVVIIIILATLCVLFATGTISFNSNKVNDNDVNDNNQNNEEDNKDNLTAYREIKLSDYAFERIYNDSNGIELYINNKVVIFESDGMKYASSTVTKMNDNVFIVEKSLGSTSLYAVNNDAKVIGAFARDDGYYKETKILPTKASYRDTYRIDGNNIYVQTDVFGNGGYDYAVCNSFINDSDIVIYEEKFEYLGNDMFSDPVVTKTVTRKEFMNENNIVCK